MNRIKQIQKIEKEYPLTCNGSSKRKIRHTFFNNIQTEIQAYLLGFYAADGSIDKKRNMLRIKLQERDSEIVNLYKIISPEARTFISGNYSSNATIRNKVIKTNKIYGIEINSIMIIHDLIKYNFGFNKTYFENHLPNLPDNLMRHFIRGYFDGDGCIIGRVVWPKDIYFQKTKDIKKPSVRRIFQIESKTKTILSDIQLFLEKCEIQTNINYIKRDDTYRLCISAKKEIDKLFHFLYDNSYFYLNRKFNKFNYYVNTEVSQIIADHRNA